MDESTRQTLLDILETLRMFDIGFRNVAIYTADTERRTVELDERIRHLEGDPCSPPATADDFDLPTEA